MNLRHSLSLTVSNAGLILKVLIYTTVLMLIGFALFSAITEPIIEAVDSDVDLLQEFEDDVAALLGIGHGGGSIGEFVNENVDSLARAAVLYVLLYMFLKLGVAFAIVPVAFYLYNKMSANFNCGFINATVSTGGKAALFALTFTALTAPVDIGILLGGGYLANWLGGALGVAGVAVAVLAVLALVALRMALTARWISEMIAENLNFKKSVKAFFLRYDAMFVKEVYPSLLFMLIFVCGTVCATAVQTLGILPIAVIPASFVLYTAIALTGYFNVAKRKYYIDERVIDPKNRF